MENSKDFKSQFFVDKIENGDVWIDSFINNTNAEDSNMLDALINEEIYDPLKTSFGFTQQEQIEMSIEHCKEILIQTPKDSQKYKQNVHKLIQLKFKLQSINEEESSEFHKHYVLYGHKFIIKKNIARETTCECCNNVIIPLFHQYLLCKNCQYICHIKCSGQVINKCATQLVNKHPSYILAIRPETGLSSQDYKCANCKVSFELDRPIVSLRVCDYSGLAYCDNCHRNEALTIPARVIHNWDFKVRGVSRRSKHFLQLMRTRPVLSLVDLNPGLFRAIPDLARLATLRRNILYTKVYLTTCKRAIGAKLLLKLGQFFSAIPFMFTTKIAGRQHFVENADSYSLQDLVDMNNGILLPELSLIYNSYVIHIKRECQICAGKGFICELCKKNEMIYPFDRGVHPCDECLAVYHADCWSKSQLRCPRCTRRNVRKMVVEDKNQD